MSGEGRRWWLLAALLISSVAIQDSHAVFVSEPLQQIHDISAAAGQPAAAAAAAAAADYPLYSQNLHQQTLDSKIAAVKSLVQLLLNNNAEVNVEVREGGPGAGLALFATRDIQQGDVLLSFPTDLGFKRTSSVGIMGFLLDYVLDVYNPESPRALMWATSPRPHELRHLLNFPQQYLPLLQHKQLEDWIGQGLHHDVQLFYKIHSDVLTAAQITYDDVVHAMGLVGTRIFNKPSAVGDVSTFYALPLLDMANHRNDCPHSNSFSPCHYDSSRECVYFRAGADVAEGEEVCFFYGYLLPDRALLEYGYLPPVAGQQRTKGTDNLDTYTRDIAPELSGIDRHDADVAVEPLMKLMERPHPFATNSKSHAEARAREVMSLLDLLQSGDAEAEAIRSQGPAAGDRSGWLLGQLLLWRQQRKQALAAEVIRLQMLL